MPAQSEIRNLYADVVDCCYGYIDVNYRGRLKKSDDLYEALEKITEYIEAADDFTDCDKLRKNADDTLKLFTKKRQIMIYELFYNLLDMNLTSLEDSEYQEYD